MRVLWNHGHLVEGLDAGFVDQSHFTKSFKRHTGMFHLKAHLADQKAIIPDAAIDAMQQQTVPTGYPSPNRYGLGW